MNLPQSKETWLQERSQRHSCVRRGIQAGLACKDLLQMGGSHVVGGMQLLFEEMRAGFRDARWSEQLVLLEGRICDTWLTPIRSASDVCMNPAQHSSGPQCLNTVIPVAQHGCTPCVGATRVVGTPLNSSHMGS